MSIGTRHLFARCSLALSLAAAATAQAQAPSAGAVDSAESKLWKLSITPYLWAAGLDGDTAADNVGTQIDTDYRFLSLDNLDFTLGVGVEAQKERWTALLDALHVSFSDASEGPSIAADAELSGGFVEASAAHRTARVDGLELVIGVRYVTLESEVRLTPGPSARRARGLARSAGGRALHARIQRSLVRNGTRRRRRVRDLIRARHEPRRPSWAIG